MKDANLTHGEEPTRVAKQNYRPKYCVWELTLKCNLRCIHCGSSAGKARGYELSLEELLKVVDQLAALDCEYVSLSGGEPTLNPHWDAIGAAVAEKGMTVNMVTNGIYRGEDTPESIARRSRDCGMVNVGVSIDGPESIHDRIRGAGTLAKTLRSIEAFKAVGLPIAILTTVSQLNLMHLPAVKKIAITAGAVDWRVQLAKPMGNMKTNDELVLGLSQIPVLTTILAQLKLEGGIHLRVGDSIGYYGPHERLLRSRPRWRRARRWMGCQAGMQVIGIEADGSVKGCLSLQSKPDGDESWVEGNVRTSSLVDIWNQPGAFAYNRDFDVSSLSGFCARCKYARVCRGGATCVASSFTGAVSEDPYCSYRIRKLMYDSHPPFVARSAATAATALFLSLGPSACDVEQVEVEYAGPEPTLDHIQPGPEPTPFEDNPYVAAEYMVLPPEVASDGSGEGLVELGIPEGSGESFAEPEYMAPEPIDDTFAEPEYMAPPPEESDPE